MTSAARKTVFTFLVFALVSLLLFLTVQLGHVARLVPLKVVVLAFGLVLFQLLLELWPGLARLFTPYEQVHLPGASRVENPREEGHHASDGSQRIGLVISWIGLAVVLAYLFGFLVGISLYLFLYLKVRAGESLRFSVVASLAAATLLFLVFEVVLGSSLYEGALFALPW